MVFDLILILIFVLLIAINVYRGALRSLAGIVSAVLSFFAATFLGKLLSSQVYDWLIRPMIEKAVTESVASIGAGAAKTLGQTLPSWMTSVIGVSGADLSGMLEKPISGAADSVVNTVNAVVMPAAVGFITLILTIVFFLLLSFILHFLLVKRIAEAFNKIPVVRVVNRFLGGVIGFVAAMLLVSLLAYILKLLMPYISSETGIFNESTIYNSFIFYHFYSGNIVSAVFSWLGL